MVGFFSIIVYSNSNPGFGTYALSSTLVIGIIANLKIRNYFKTFESSIEFFICLLFHIAGCRLIMTT
jgi:hypothetical protein